MNTEQLLSLVRELNGDEKNTGIQGLLKSLAQALTNLVNNPSAPSHQTEAAKALDTLSRELDDLEATYRPATLARMEEIGARIYFTSAMARRVRQSMADNAMTPAVVQTEVTALVEERSDYLLHLERTQESLETFGFNDDDLEPGEAQAGFQIPRAIFENELGGLSRELHELRTIIRAFSEAAGNAGERIEVRQISTSDPLIYVVLAYLTVTKLAGGLKWCLEQWKTMEEIRNLRASTANLKGVPGSQAIAEQFDAVIQQSVQTGIRQEAERIASEAGTDQARENELANHLAKALEGLLARIERGMTVDIRFLAPPPESGDDDAEQTAEQAGFERLRELRQELVFPRIGDAAPLLKLEKLPELPEPKKRRSAR